MPPGETHRPVLRTATETDVAAVARLRRLWEGGEEPAFERRVAEWLAAEGDRRTTWLAFVAGAPAGMVSLFEYRRMPKPGRPDSAWGYVSTLFVREELRGAGLGAALLAAVTDAADARGYVRLVVSPADLARPLYRRAGFDGPADGLLVRPGRRSLPSAP